MFKKIISILIAVIMLAFSFSVVVSAEDTIDDNDEEYIGYYKTTYSSQKARVDTMTLEVENDYFALYFDRKSGEFALMNKKTGEYTFSNPYDLNEKTSIVDNLAKNALHSQVMIEYQDTLTGTAYYISSFGSASASGQLSYKSIADGIRVEYAIGTVESKRLIPMMIEKNRFEENILSVLEAEQEKMTEDELTIYHKMAYSFRDGDYYTGDFDGYYAYYDQTDIKYTEMVSIWRDDYHCLVTHPEMQIYVLQADKERNKSQIERLIRKYCPLYTYDELEYDHDLTEYEAQEKELPLFRLAD